jgi:hypothetical protein
MTRSELPRFGEQKRTVANRQPGAGTRMSKRGGVQRKASMPSYSIGQNSSGSSVFRNASPLWKLIVPPIPAYGWGCRDECQSTTNADKRMR